MFFLIYCLSWRKFYWMWHLLPLLSYRWIVRAIRTTSRVGRAS